MPLWLACVQEDGNTGSYRPSEMTLLYYLSKLTCSDGEKLMLLSSWTVIMSVKLQYICPVFVVEFRCRCILTIGFG